MFVIFDVVLKNIVILAQYTVACLYFFPYKLNTFSKKSVKIYWNMGFGLKTQILPNNMCLHALQLA